MRVEPGLEPPEVPGPAVAVADRVELELVVRRAGALQQLVVELDHLGVDSRIGRAERLDRELPMLAEAPALRRRVPVDRGDRVELLRLRLLVQAVLEIRAGDRRGRLGA